MIDLSHKKIIVTFLMHLGDLVLTTPFIHALRKAAPTAEITYLVDDKLKDVVLHNPYPRFHKLACHSPPWVYNHGGRTKNSL